MQDAQGPAASSYRHTPKQKEIARNAIKLPDTETSCPSDVVQLIRPLAPADTRGDGNQLDFQFLEGRMRSPHAYAFPVPLCHSLTAHIPGGQVPRERGQSSSQKPKTDGTTLSAFMKIPEQETLNILFKCFDMVLVLQQHPVEKESSVLGDLHDLSITVLQKSDGTFDFALVDGSGLLPLA